MLGVGQFERVMGGTELKVLVYYRVLKKDCFYWFSVLTFFRSYVDKIPFSPSLLLS